MLESVETFALVGVPASEASGAFVGGSTAESEKTDRLC